MYVGLNLTTRKIKESETRVYLKEIDNLQNIPSPTLHLLYSKSKCSFHFPMEASEILMI